MNRAEAVARQKSFKSIFLTFKLILLLFFIYVVFTRALLIEKKYIEKNLKIFSSAIENKFKTSIEEAKVILDYSANTLEYYDKESFFEYLNNKLIVPKNSIWEGLIFADSDSDIVKSSPRFYGNFYIRKNFGAITARCIQDPGNLKISSDFYNSHNFGVCVGVEDAQGELLFVILLFLDNSKFYSLTNSDNGQDVDYNFAVFGKFGDIFIEPKDKSISKYEYEKILQYIRNNQGEKKIRTSNFLGSGSAYIITPIENQYYVFVSLKKLGLSKTLSILSGETLFIFEMLSLLAFLLFCIFIIDYFIAKPTLLLSNYAESTTSIHNIELLSENFKFREYNLIKLALNKVQQWKLELKNEKAKAKLFFSKAQSIERQRFDFVKNMSHKLRTPLHQIVTSLDLIKKDPSLNQSLLNYVKISELAIQELKISTENIITLASVKLGRLKFDTNSSIDLKKLLKIIIGQFYNLSLFRKDIKIDLEISDDLPKINVNKKKFQLALKNILHCCIGVAEDTKFIKISTSIVFSGLKVDFLAGKINSYDNQLKFINDAIAEKLSENEVLNLNLGLEFIMIGSIMRAHSIPITISESNGHVLISFVIPNIRLKGDNILN